MLNFFQNKLCKILLSHLVFFTSVAGEAFSQDIIQDSTVVELYPNTHNYKQLHHIQELNSANLKNSHSTNLLEALSGNVSGFKIASASGNQFGSVSVQSRGINNLSGNSKPLIVLDGVPLLSSDLLSTNGDYDYGSVLQDIPVQEIKEVKVISGASASMLYGSAASNGAIIINTNSHFSDDKYVGVDYEYTSISEKVIALPKLQYEYGGGNSSSFQQVQGSDENIYNTVDYMVDESWGPKLDGTEVVHWYNLDQEGTIYGTSPWVAPNITYEDFYDRGHTGAHHVTAWITTPLVNSRFTYSRTNNDGYTPNSDYNHDRLKGYIALKPIEKITFSLSANYLKQKVMGRPAVGTNNLNINTSMIQWTQTQLDYDHLQNFIYQGGHQAAWNRRAIDNSLPLSHNNPYWTRYYNFQNDNRTHNSWNAQASFAATDWLDLTTRYFGESYSFNSEERIAIGSVQQSQFSTNAQTEDTENFELLVNMKRQYGDWNLIGSLTGGVQNQKSTYKNASTNGGLSVAGIYALYNSNQPASIQTIGLNLKNTYYKASVTANWKETIFTEVSGIIDSPEGQSENNSDFGVSAAYVFRKPLPNSLFSYGTVRGLIHHGVRQSIFSTANYLTSDLSAETVADLELGTSLVFFKNRLTVDFTYYANKTNDAIFPITVNSGTGYSNRLINIGSLTNKGIQLNLSADILKFKDFNWKVDGNFYTNNFEMNFIPEFTSLSAEEYRGVKVQVQDAGNLVLMGTAIERDNTQGNAILNSDGQYATITNQDLGKVMPDYNMGIRNTFRFKDLDLSFLFDIQKGGHYISYTNRYGMYAGTLIETTANNIREDGIVLEGKNRDGSTNMTRISAEEYGKMFNSVDELNVFDASYIKLRDLSIGYNLTGDKLGIKFIDKIRFSAFGRNLLILGLDNQHVDPESAVTSSSPWSGAIEEAALLPTKTYGFSIKVQLKHTL
ncbi:TonB-dependent receptor plug domain-containing protein [Limibacter armeniacum]|uniref:TonB-dependent receptor plug domain-containing protein n=1 Tax=Limibacter armeniacum TaxID=466084 RepID=UPI002FE67F34